ncbi:MAG: hypothetical protein OXG78_03290 [Chloroflexi bacterium]|nr:hypothetical protein [Chloroflexota bacterium]
MSNKRDDKAWYERIGLLTGIGVLIGIVFGLGRNDLLFGIVMGFFLGAGVPLGAIGSRWYRARSDGEGNLLVMAVVFAIVAGIIVAIFTTAISGILDSVNEFVKGILTIALDSGSSIVWGIAIGIGTAVGAGLRAVLGKKD